MQSIAKNSLYGILWILANNLTMAIQTATIKSSSLEGKQVVFLYKLTVFLLVSIWIAYRGFNGIKTKKIHLHLLKALLSTLAAVVFVSALKHIPLSTATAIGYTEPLIVSILAILLLKEQLKLNIIIAAIFGFIGVLSVLKLSTLTEHSFWVLGAAFIWAFDNIVIKLLGKTETSATYLFYISFFSALFGFFFAYQVWQPVQLVHLPWIFGLAILYFIHLLAAFKAFQYASLSVLAPFDFSRIIFATIIGVTLFNEKIDLWDIIGGLIIVSSVAYIITQRENILKDERNL